MADIYIFFFAYPWADWVLVLLFLIGSYFTDSSTLPCHDCMGQALKASSIAIANTGCHRRFFFSRINKLERKCMLIFCVRKIFRFKCIFGPENYRKVRINLIPSHQTTPFPYFRRRCFGAKTEGRWLSNKALNNLTVSICNLKFRYILLPKQKIR